MSAETEPTELEKAGLLAKPDITLKLDLACGRHCQDGFEGVDIVKLVGADKTGPDGKVIGKHPDVMHVVDLQSYPWPWADNSVLEIHCSHYAEHIPMYPMIDGRQDPLMRFMDELYRIIHPEGTIKIIVPSGRSDRGFQDPTHRRFFVEMSFAYFNGASRRAMGVDHYVNNHDFDVNVNQIVDTVVNAMHPEAAARHVRQYWNTTVDFHAVLKPNKK